MSATDPDQLVHATNMRTTHDPVMQTLCGLDIVLQTTRSAQPASRPNVSVEGPLSGEYEAIAWEVNPASRSVDVRVRRVGPFGPPFTITIPMEYLEDVRRAANVGNREVVTQLVRRFHRVASNNAMRAVIGSNTAPPDPVQPVAEAQPRGRRLVDLGD